MKDKIKIAAVQMDPKLKKKDGNLEKITLKAKEAAGEGAELVVFPECAVTGYMFNSRSEAMVSAETIPGPTTERLETLCRELVIHVVVGLLEADEDRCFNVAVLMGPQGLVGKYRKTHLPFLGVDRFLDPGDNPFRVYRTPVGNIGMYICYDCNFPETARVMALQGADILILPTNWPGSRGIIPQYVINTRAFENRVFVVAVDRVGTERGSKFIGMSKITSPSGDTLAEGSRDNEEILYAEVNLAEARLKHAITRPGEFELDCIGDRRPELYGRLTYMGVPGPM
jgi:predicted amidohydrolase